MTADFLTHLTSELVACLPRRHFNNVDRVRFSIATRASYKELALKLAARLGFYRAPLVDTRALKTIIETQGLDRAYSLLSDDTSRNLFVKLLAYRVLGHEHVSLPRSNQEYWATYNSLDKYTEKRNSVTGVPILGSLDTFRYRNIRLHTTRKGLMITFVLEQYRCPRARIGVKNGDIVADAGGCWGDTALYFAQDAQRVYCFECIPSNLEIIRKNFEMNPDLGRRVRVCPMAVWDRSGEKLFFADAGPGSHVGPCSSGIQVETTTIDEFFSGRVDFIKMDIEGAELKALAGAEQTIRKCKPQLAICIYHDISHFARIPTWIDDLGLGYKFYLDHFTIHAEETILFARAD
jgi:FkbM family methyltransferase